MVTVSNADRIVFPAVSRTKGDVVAYYERIADKALPHLRSRPLSIQRFPKGTAQPGFFQKNVPPHYPASIVRFEVPRSQAATKKHAAGKAGEDVTVYPLVNEPEHLAYLANQGAIELHVTTARIDPGLGLPDRLVFDLDPPRGAVDLVRKSAFILRDELGQLGLETVPVATGSKGYHLVSPIVPEVDDETLSVTLQKAAAWLAHRHPETLTDAFRIANRKGRVFVDWLRNRPNATVVAPYSLRARPHASICVPLTWTELETTAPDAFTLSEQDEVFGRADPLLERAETPSDAKAFVVAVDDAFEASGLTFVPFDRFRS